MVDDKHVTYIKTKANIFNKYFDEQCTLLKNSALPINQTFLTHSNFEKIIFNKIYHFLFEERLLNPKQSGFRPSDSCINQLLAITHEIFEVFDCNPTLEVRSVF